MLHSLLHRRPRHATVVAYVALFVALGGSSYAALRIGSGQIVNNSVRSEDIRNNDIRSQDVRNRSLLAEDFKPGQLPAGRAGPAGATGASGATGLGGPQGPPGISGLERIVVSSGAQNSSSPKQATATCSAGKRVIGASAEIQGGTNLAADLTDVVIDEIVPSPENVVPGTVTVQAIEEEASATNWSVSAYALCANVS